MNPSWVAQMIKNLPAMQETRVQSLGREDPLEKGMATYSTIVAWRIPWTAEPDRLYSSWGLKESDMTEQLTLSLSSRDCVDSYLCPNSACFPTHSLYSSAWPNFTSPSYKIKLTSQWTPLPVVPP